MLGADLRVVSFVAFGNELQGGEKVPEFSVLELL
jgi:hypothetical protein